MGSEARLSFAIKFLVRVSSWLPSISDCRSERFAAELLLLPTNVR
jgi:hypothetical protein